MQTDGGEPGQSRAGPAAPPQACWTVLDGAGLLACSICLQTGLATLVGAFKGGLGVQLTAAAAGNVAVLMLVWWLVGRRCEPTVRAASALGFWRFRRRTVLRSLKVIAAGAAAYLSIATAVFSGFHYFGGGTDKMPLQPLVELIRATESGALVGLASLVAIIFAPVTEEVLFRSVLYLPLRRHVGVVPAALMVSVAFSLVHMYPLGAGNLVVLSLTFVALLEVTGTLWAPILAHGLYNGLMIVLVRTFPLPG
jgi:membrane protease YdiL (CAAX protease family)